MKTGTRTEKISWQKIQDEIAEEKATAIVLLDETASELTVSNNNSMCDFLYNSEEFAPRCAEFCGKAFEIAHEAGNSVHIKCHADLNFFAVPLQSENKKMAAIVGRVLLNGGDYRAATERLRDGDWQQFPPENFLANVLISRSLNELEKNAKRLEKLDDAEKKALAEFLCPPLAHENDSPENLIAVAEPDSVENSLPSKTAEVAEKNVAEVKEFAAWRRILESLLDLDYRQGCFSLSEFLAERYGMRQTAWLELRGAVWEKVFAFGNLNDQPIKIAISENDERLVQAFQAESALELRERADGRTENLQTLQMFPFAVGGKMRGALLVADRIEDEKTKKRISRFLRNITPELEILRLRDELERRAKLTEAVKKFNESLKDIDRENFWSAVVQASAELMQAERGSLLAFDSENQKFYLKAAVGSRADVIEAENAELLGERISLDILKTGKAVAVENIEDSEFPDAPAEWKYKTKSFISYPIKIGTRPIGIFNAADKIDGGFYSPADLELLDALAPQIAVALDRTTIKKRAGEFERLSVTDALTGLLNRRYLEERLSEEINRSQRTGDSVSFMMIDVDEFKSYNDKFSHPEGDKALQIVGRLMKETLRSEDVAVRYGGEEFSILLPQTSLAEACIIAERIRQKVESEQFPNRKVTISVGVAAVSPRTLAPHDLISAADRALYKAKQAGRNTIKIHEDYSSGFAS